MAFGVSLWRRPFVPGEGLWLVLALVHGGSVLLGPLPGPLAVGRRPDAGAGSHAAVVGAALLVDGSAGLGEPLPLAVAILAAGSL
jgi:hypothetical protein